MNNYPGSQCYNYNADYYISHSGNSVIKLFLIKYLGTLKTNKQQELKINRQQNNKSGTAFSGQYFMENNHNLVVPFKKSNNLQMRFLKTVNVSL